jgi:hypothetical protein
MVGGGGCGAGRPPIGCWHYCAGRDERGRRREARVAAAQRDCLKGRSATGRESTQAKPGPAAAPWQPQQRGYPPAAAAWLHGCCGGWHDGSELLLLRLAAAMPARGRRCALAHARWLLLLAAGRLWLNATVVAPACLQFTLSCLFHSRSSKKIRLWMG